MFNLFSMLVRKFNFLEYDLNLARWNISSESFVRRVFMSSLMISLAIVILLTIFFIYLEVATWLPFIVFLPLWAMTFFYNLHLPKYRAFAHRKYVDIEIVSMIRFLVLELKSGKTLYDSLKSVSDHFTLIGVYIDEIVNEVEMGSEFETVLREQAETISSIHLRSVLWQILNSIQTGTNITRSLEGLLEDIIEEQKIELEAYGRELNALSLFYMMIAIILPTIGITIVTAILTFIGIGVETGALVVVWMILSLIQYLFLIISMNRRPAVEA